MDSHDMAVSLLSKLHLFWSWSSSSFSSTFPLQSHLSPRPLSTPPQLHDTLMQYITLFLHLLLFFTDLIRLLFSFPQKYLWQIKFSYKNLKSFSLYFSYMNFILHTFWHLFIYFFYFLVWCVFIYFFYSFTRFTLLNTRSFFSFRRF